MGGTIAITIRVDEQNTYKMLRWTNPIPDFVHDIRFLNKDRDYLMEYIDQETEYGGKGQVLAPDGMKKRRKNELTGKNRNRHQTRNA